MEDGEVGIEDRQFKAQEFAVVARHCRTGIRPLHSSKSLEVCLLRTGRAADGIPPPTQVAEFTGAHQSPQLGGAKAHLVQLGDAQHPEVVSEGGEGGKGCRVGHGPIVRERWDRPRGYPQAWLPRVISLPASHGHGRGEMATSLPVKIAILSLGPLCNLCQVSVSRS